ncbi:MAG: hypothetical protein M3178_04900 [Pseudomonadota bacterium]|nr:hypothetical protein [Pseudomonadota bacterium]
MSWTERQRCRFQPYPDGDGRPSRLYIDIAESHPSLLTKKQIGALFLTIGNNVSWIEANALADELNAKIDLFCVNHLAAGEGS